MKGKCNLCGTKCSNEFCAGCVYYLQRKMDRVLPTARKTMSYIPDPYPIARLGGKSDFLSLQCKYNEG